MFEARKASWAVAIASVLFGALPAQAATTLNTAPYSADSTNEYCIVYHAAYCVTDATASRSDGSVSLEAGVHAPAMSDGTGSARADGIIKSLFKPSTSARTVKVVANIRVSSASTSTKSLQSNARSHVRALVTLNVACATCPGGSAIAETLITIVDTDPVTAEPSTLAGATTNVSLSVSFGPGQKPGQGILTVRFIAQGFLESHLQQPVEQVAEAHGRLLLESVAITY